MTPQANTLTAEQSSTQTTPEPGILQNFIGGSWVSAKASDALDVTNPANGEVIDLMQSAIVSMCCSGHTKMGRNQILLYLHKSMPGLNPRSGYLYIGQVSATRPGIYLYTLYYRYEAAMRPKDQGAAFASSITNRRTPKLADFSGRP